jgi:hypothetical protein
MAVKRGYGTAGFCRRQGYLRTPAVPGAQEGKGKVRALRHIRQGQGIAGRGGASIGCQKRLLMSV